jgi:ubiquinone/menaquinone biosynthesis C-methylase UbiE
LRRLGDLSGKLVLCLGNGSAAKELYFAHLGARVIISDLSLTGVLDVKRAHDLGVIGDRVSFHAINAYEIPMPDSSVDVVYGFEFVHHLPDLPSFMDEVARVLKPGGICVFFDGAYSPIWQKAKMTALRPLMKLSHLLHKRSPEDIRATYSGGYKEEDLARLGKQVGLAHGFFERTAFFQYLLVHGVGDIFGWRLPGLFYRVPGQIGRWMDKLLTNRIDALSRSRIELVWGFEKGGN